MVYSPLDALKIARQNPDRQVVFLAIGFETTAPSTAVTRAAGGRGGARNFSVFCNHVTIIPGIKAILDSPDLRLDGFIGPGHVSTVIGCRPYEFIAREYRKPLVVAGFEPLDMLQSVYLLLRQLAEGRCEVENQYARVVPWDGNPTALQRGRRGDASCGRTSSGAGSASSRTRRCGCATSTRPSTPSGSSRARGAGGRPQGLPVRRGAQGRAETVGVQGVRHRVHAGDADRHLHGLLGGRLRGLLQLRPVHARATVKREATRRDGATARSSRSLDRIERARRAPRRGCARNASRWRTAPAARRPRP